ncbi:MAG: NUDIX domain-containing protein [Rhabdochlamydiaceae bacterium]|nr:NUDIX domain-containing protein [Rhabdochlamydiaceae bacterium]
MHKPNFIAAYLVDLHAKPEPLLLLLKRAPNTHLEGIWQIVTGKVEPDENVLKALKREVLEETGIEIHQAYNVNITLFYERTKDQIGYSANFFVNLDHKENITLAPKEHSEHLWCSFAKARELLAFSTQKETLLHLEEYYKDIKSNNASLLFL